MDRAVPGDRRGGELTAAPGPIARLGALSVEQWRELRYLLAVAYTVLVSCLTPRRWPRTVRYVLSSQICFTGVQAIRLVSLVAILVGVSIVLQARLWLTEVGQSRLLGPVLVAVVARELAPLLCNLVVLVRSGSAIATELGNMAVRGEVRILEAQGLDALGYLVVPRVAGMAISVFCLTVLFTAVSFASGYFCALCVQDNPQAPIDFVDSILAAIGPIDAVAVVAKSVLPALLTGVICCTGGLSAGAAITEVPRATTRALSRSLVAVFVVSAAISISSYA